MFSLVTGFWFVIQLTKKFLKMTTLFWVFQIWSSTLSLIFLFSFSTSGFFAGFAVLFPSLEINSSSWFRVVFSWEHSWFLKQFSLWNSFLQSRQSLTTSSCVIGHLQLEHGKETCLIEFLSRFLIGLKFDRII